MRERAVECRGVGSFGGGQVGVSGREGEVVDWVSGGRDDVKVFGARIGHEEIL